MPVKFNINQAMKLWKENGGKSKFEDSLKKVLTYIQNDKNISNIDEASYLLATAKAESDYSLQRWEADYLCGEAGVPYKNEPCQRAIDYYASSNGKKNYFDLGVDDKGMAYFGRGLIQLTGKANYEKYGKLIGVDLAKDGDKALEPKNSYKIASTYLKERTWKHIANGDLLRARKSVNGGTKGVDDVNEAFFLWVKILENSKVNFKGTKLRRKTRRTILFSSIGIALVGIAVLTTTLINKK